MLMISDNTRRVRSRAPLRLGLAGGGTDVSPYSDDFGGAVLNATINLYAYANIELLAEDQVVFEALDLQKQQAFPLDAAVGVSCDLLLHSGVYNRIMREYNDGKPIALRITTHSDAPMGSGLGSSSAMVVALLLAFVELFKLPLGEYDVARLAFDIERVDLGMQGGKQDQYAATFGGFNFMEFYRDRVIVNPLRIKQETIAELNYNLLLFYLGTSRLSSEIIDAQIKNVQAGKSKPIEAMHQLKEQAVKQKEAILRGNLREFGRLLGNSWESKKQMSEKISNAGIDRVYGRCMELGALGVKVSGAGGGGFMMIYCDGHTKFKVIDGLKGPAGELVKFQFTNDGAGAWPMQRE